MKKNLEEIINTIQLLPSKPNPFETLTESEFGVLELIISGCSAPEIAEIQYTSKNTVRNHTKKIYSKAGIPGKDRHHKCIKATILYMIYHPKSFLDSYTKEELENVKLIDDLTPRQLSVLEYYIMGFSYKKIADKLKMSKNTVHSHLPNIFYKLYLEEKNTHKKNIKAMRLYILRYPEIIPSLYSQVKHFTANSGKYHSKKGIEKEIDIEPILSNITSSSDLTPRELEILDGLIEGESNKELADRLFISKNTLRSHIKSINEKWDIKWEGVGTREATLIARQQTYTKALEMRNNSKK